MTVLLRVGNVGELLPLREFKLRLATTVPFDDKENENFSKYAFEDEKNKGRESIQRETERRTAQNYVTLGVTTEVLNDDKQLEIQ